MRGVKTQKEKLPLKETKFEGEKVKKSNPQIKAIKSVFLDYYIIRYFSLTKYNITGEFGIKKFIPKCVLDTLEATIIYNNFFESL